MAGIGAKARADDRTAVGHGPRPWPPSTIAAINQPAAYPDC
jgi:hypothetical protein